MAVRPVPDGYHTVTAQLTIDGAARAIDRFGKITDPFGLGCSP